MVDNENVELPKIFGDGWYHHYSPPMRLFALLCRVNDSRADWSPTERIYFGGAGTIWRKGV
ncbi:hypothetical protein ACFSUK_18575 [Sphingobium scionense]